MDAMEAIVTRRSVRSYLDIPVEWEKIGMIVEAARWAPSSGNLQNCKFIVVESLDQRHSIAEACLEQFWIEKAPVIIVAVADITKTEQFYGIRGDRLYTIQNCAAAIQNMLICATSLGLHTCWIGAFDEDKIRGIVSLPGDVRPQAVITVGYAKEVPSAPQRFNLDDVLFLGGFGNRIRDMDDVLGYHSGKVQRVIEAGKKEMEKLSDSINEHGPKLFGDINTNFKDSVNDLSVKFKQAIEKLKKK